MRAGGLGRLWHGYCHLPNKPAGIDCEIEIKPDGSAVVKTAAHDLGTGAYTILAQIAAATLGIPIGTHRSKTGDSDLPMAPVAGGSQTSASVGSAVKVTSQKALASLKERAAADSDSPLFQTKPKELTVASGRIFVSEDPSKGELISDLLQRNGGRPIAAQGSASPPSKAGNEEEPITDPENTERYSKQAWGAQFVEIRIDPDLRQLRVARAVGAFAAGKILNAKTAHSQIMGGIVWGVSMALLEQTIHDPVRGRVVNDNLATIWSR